MTLRKFSHLAPGTRAQLRLLCGVALASLVGCSSINNLMDGDKVEYKSSGKAPSLEVPPDLTQLQRDSRYAIPDAKRGTATASGFNQQQGGQAAVAAAPGSPQIAPLALVDRAGGTVRIERAGNQRWLVVPQSPEALWPQVKDFWVENGFLVNSEAPEAGIMETDWAENRAKIPQDIVRSTIGKVFEGLYSTGERDRFRTRLERGANGATEIYISHRGVQEVVTGQQNDGTRWAPRASDPALEVQFLARLMARLGGEAGQQGKTVAAGGAPQAEHAKLVKAAGGVHVEVDEGMDRAWRRVGLALDRVGFTVEDRDRILGTYFVRYIDQDPQGKGEPGFFGKLFSFGSSEKEKDAQRYRVLVKAGDGGSSQVSVLDNQGKPETSPTGEKILNLLVEQLK